MAKKIRTTQVDSLKQLKPKLGKRRQSVYNALVYLNNSIHIPSTNRMIAKHLEWDINRVTGRVTELVSLGKAIASGVHKDADTNRNVTTWKAL